jgi:hypothetical protein
MRLHLDTVSQSILRTADKMRKTGRENEDEADVHIGNRPSHNEKV